MSDPRQIDGDRTPDPYVDEIPHSPGDTIPHPNPEEQAPEWPEGQVPPEEQSDG
ncbi:hypothetical protein G7009_20455 [Pseudomonas capeferrum]|uniref:hypothetical protein n=1 Tax=Pseudomonas capeferrum TaxID=1495066 RepID=UPI0015E36069|nr:hypothetical protein [Pseudomonas capeferrum]MBA1204096.1 hypothetical protein [Pseudomonas capeferrum]